MDEPQREARIIMTARTFALPVLLLAATAIEAAGPPPAPREFRASWVATVENIDWPSKPGLSTADQQREAIVILDRARALNMNAVIVQVRPGADALYDSKLEPWSYYLTGEQGKPPSPMYDPLAFWVEQAHARGLQLHAWFNPFRARVAGATFDLAASHVGKTHPEWVKAYGKMLWMDPGEPAALAHSLAVFKDVVDRYDVDGVHIDDYFYPYPISDPDTKAEVDFPDDASWAAYRAGGGTLARHDWRRDAINRLVADLYAEVKKSKPHVLVGISPFGIPRPGRPPGVVGFDQYAKLYADAELWTREGWLDYLTPQLYWKVDAPGQPYLPLLRHWIGENAKNRHIWPGLSISRVGTTPTSYAPDEIFRQIAIMRETPGASGVVLFSEKALGRNARDLADRLRAEVFTSPALVPASPWLGANAPAKPMAKRDGPKLALAPGDGGEPVSVWAVWSRRGEAWTFRVEPGASRTIALEGPAVDEVVVSGVSRTGAEGPRVVIGR
jgi:uncharacterized lipoprotein YddW (UPF0748 family)